MKVPLMAKVNNEDGTTKLDIWRNKRKIVAAPPIQPYLYVVPDIHVDDEYSSYLTHKTLLSTLEPMEVTKVEFNTTSEMWNFKEEHEALLRSTDLADAKMNFIHRVLVDCPDFYEQFPNDEELTVLHFDIEQTHDPGRFPTEDDFIVSVAVAVNNEAPKVFMAREASLAEEGRILRELFNYWSEKRPDIVVGYNHVGYDIPMVLARSRVHHINFGSILTRNPNAEPILDEDRIKADGIVYYDLMHSVFKDQTLHGIKNRKMKTVAKWFGLEDVIEVEHDDIENLIGTEELASYNRSDVRITQQLFDIYFPKILAMAEYLGSPLSELIPFADSYPGTIIQARIMFRKGIISDGKNMDRHPTIFRDEYGNKRKFEAADVKLFRKGLFQPVYHYDFASLYPHIMVGLEIGPDNTTIVGLDELKDFECWEVGKNRIYSIPDQNIGKNVVIKVTGESEVARYVNELLRGRLDLKRKAKKAKKEGKDHAGLESLQYSYKVVLNSLYGLNGAGHLHYGDASVAILIVGIGRLLIRHLATIVGSSAIEYDTDGIYVSRFFEAKELTDEINMYLTMHLLGKPVMTVEGDKYKAGYFHEMKNYILLDQNDNLVRHGAGFKGSNLPGIFDKTIETVGRELLENGEKSAKELARKAMDLSRYRPDDFYQSVKLGKDIEEYNSESVLSVQVARDAEKKIGQPPRKGTQYTYIKTNRGYEMFDMDSFGRMDTRYYRGIIETALERMGFSGVMNMTLGEFF